jgi:hypothetical protein
MMNSWMRWAGLLGAALLLLLYTLYGEMPVSWKRTTDNLSFVFSYEPSSTPRGNTVEGEECLQKCRDQLAGEKNVLHT